MSSFCQNLQCYYVFFSFQLFICCNTAFCFLEMIILISKVGILTQSRIGVETNTFSSIGPMKGKYVFLIP